MRVAIKVSTGGYSIEFFKIVEWKKQVGDQVKKDEVLLEYESDKGLIECPSPSSGVLAEIIPGDNGYFFRPEGEKGDWSVKVGWIEASADNTTALEKPEEKVFKESKLQAELGKSIDVPGEIASVPAPETDSCNLPKMNPCSPETAAPSATCAASKESEKCVDSFFIKAGPMVRRIARERGINLKLAVPTGTHGTVTIDDLGRVQAIVSLRKESVEMAPINKTAAELEEKSAAKDAPDAFEIIPLTPARAAIARNMKIVRSCIPDAQTEIWLDMRKIMRAKTLARWNGLTDKIGEDKVKIYLRLEVIVIEGILRALEGKWRILNSCFGCEDFDFKGIKLFRDINLGIAYSHERGLMVPVLSRMQGSTYKTIAERTSELYRKMDEGKVALEEIIGENRTFTFNNVGALGAKSGESIIPHGTSAICVLHATDQDLHKPFAGFAILNLSFDHRAYDGREAVGFLNTVKEFVEGVDFIKHVLRQFDEFP